MEIEVKYGEEKQMSFLSVIGTAPDKSSASMQSLRSNRFDMYIFWLFFKPKLYMTWKRIFECFKRAIARTKTGAYL